MVWDGRNVKFTHILHFLAKAESVPFIFFYIFFRNAILADFLLYRAKIPIAP